jgi:hypothetical protein
MRLACVVWGVLPSFWGRPAPADSKWYRFYFQLRSNYDCWETAIRLDTNKGSQMTVFEWKRVDFTLCVSIGFLLNFIIYLIKSSGSELKIHYYSFAVDGKGVAAFMGELRIHRWKREEIIIIIEVQILVFYKDSFRFLWVLCCFRSCETILKSFR